MHLRKLFLTISLGWKVIGVFRVGVLRQPTTEAAAHRPILVVRRRPLKGGPPNPPVKSSAVVTSLAEPARVDTEQD